MLNPRVLTFNFHEPYICLMAKTGIPLEIGLNPRPPFNREWQTKFRPVPENITFVEEAQWRPDLAAGKYGVVIAQNENNARDISREVADSRTPALLVMHNGRRYLESMLPQDDPDARANYQELLNMLRQIYHFVYISDMKRASFKIPGRVIQPGIDVEEYGGYEGGEARVLRVGNVMRARNVMFDVDFQEAACEGLPNTVLGEDPEIPSARPSESFGDLLNHYRSHRCLLHVTREDYEDGYNLAMLEAMACGMPIVSLANETSPITDGVDGYVAADAETVRSRLQTLLDDQGLAANIGAKGRETVARMFPIDRFVESWRAAIHEAAEWSPISKSHEAAVPAMDVLVQYLASPVTTGRYIEDSLRKRHRVTSAGFRMPEELLASWGFPETRAAYRNHDIQLPLEGAHQFVADKLPEGWAPSIYLWIDSGPKELPADLESIPGVKVCYLIDTHIAPDIRIEWARHFDYVFLAQRGQMEMFKSAGIENVHWLPLACSADLHRVARQSKQYDWAYIGRTTDDADDRRRGRIEALRGRFPNAYVGTAWPEDMARIYAQSKIVVNACANNDVNMRVFEAMASGALLITDNADGLDALYEEGTHYVTYADNAGLIERVDYYLSREEERARIANAGHAYTLAQHTYDQRIETMLSAVLDDLGAIGGISGESRFNRGGYYRSERHELLPHLPKGAKQVLDVGCGAGDFGRVLKKRGVDRVVGIEIVPRAWEIAKEQLDEVILGNIEEMDLPFEEDTFDAVFCNDVLEHLVNPLEVLKKIRHVLKPGGSVIISIPNVRFYEVVHMLAANGRWEYVDAGIMDRTHLRFFTAVELAQMMNDAQLNIDTIQPLSGVDEATLPRNPDGSLTIGRMTVRDVSDSEYAEYRTYQYLVKALKPGAHTLADAQAALDRRDDEEAYRLANSCAAGDADERTFILAKAAARMGRLSEAKQFYEALLKRKPDHAIACGEYGILCVAENRIEDGAPWIEKGLAANPQDDRLIAAKGLVHLARGENDAALDQFIAVAQANKQSDAVIPHMIELSEVLGRTDEAIPVARAFVEFAPGNIAAVCAYARMMMNAGHIDEARDRVERARLMAPDDETLSALAEEITAASPR